MPAGSNISMSNDVITAIESGRKIQAIKLLRADAGLGLKEAKEKIESYINSQPELKATFDSKRTTLNLSQQQFSYILFVVIGLLLAYWLL